MLVGGFPARAAGCLSLLLYSPAQDGKHIKCFPLRAELATNLNSRHPGPGIQRARGGKRYLPKRDRFILVGFIWENAALHGDPHPFATFFRESDK